MCGIAGFLDFAGAFDGDRLRALAEAQNAALVHRGPDTGDIWIDAAAGIALAHRRLSIVDLSPAGRQPMVSSCGRYVISYNGEAYNTLDLRRDLEARGRPFRGHSDTEVIVEGFAEWGVRRTLERLNGMFALALWDRTERRLFLARDRLGIKPLYWARTGQGFVFGSELKALRAYAGCPADIDRNAVAAFLRHNYVPAPYTILQDVFKLRPGRILTIGADGGTPTEESFWDFDDVVGRGRETPFTGDDTEAIDRLEDLLKDSVKRQMVADVPLGVFLSGGIDSSTVCALMQVQSARPVRSFSIGFEEAGYDESRHAAAIAAHLGTDHTELHVTAQEARDVIPSLPTFYDEPFADSSQIPTYLLAKLTRGHVTVALSGDGGDELFAGYTRYFTAQSFARHIARLPMAVRAMGARMIRTIPPRHWDAIFRMVPRSRRPVHGGDRIYKLADVLTEDTAGFYRRLISHWWEPEGVVANAVEPKGLAWDEAIQTRFARPVEWMQYLDTLTYLPDDILTKVDRASMAVALEARVPLLDHRVVAFAWTLPFRMKIRDGQGKWALRQVLHRHVPQALVDRPKMGFGVPIDAWLRGPLREWAETLLAVPALERHGLVDPSAVRQVWNDHLSGRRNWQYHLWDVLMLQAWCDHWRPQTTAAGSSTRGVDQRERGRRPATAGGSAQSMMKSGSIRDALVLRSPFASPFETSRRAPQGEAKGRLEGWPQVHQIDRKKALERFPF